MQIFIIGVISAVLLLVRVYLYIVSVIVDNMYDRCNMCHRSLKHIIGFTNLIKMAILRFV